VLAGILLAGSAAAQVPDQTAALMYVQSYVSPALIEVCKGVMPGTGARLDDALPRWRDRNRDLIAQGERVLQSVARGEGSNMEATLATQRDALLQQFRALPAPDQTERCGSLLGVLESEARR